LRCLLYTSNKLTQRLFSELLDVHVPQSNLQGLRKKSELIQEIKIIDTFSFFLPPRDYPGRKHEKIKNLKIIKE
jgi:hypothetical protein